MNVRTTALAAIAAATVGAQQCQSHAATTASLSPAANQAALAQTWAVEYAELGDRLIRDRSIGGLRKAERADATVLDPHSLLWHTDRMPADVVLRRTAALLQSIRHMPGAPDMSRHLARLSQLRERRAGLAKSAATGAEADREVFMEACALRRAVALDNPLLDFDQLLFATMNGGICCLQGQNYGYSYTRGGGIFVASGFKSGAAQIRNILDGATVESGRLKGTTLTGGAVNTPALSYDGTRIVFSYVEDCGASPLDWPVDTVINWSERRTFHLFRINTDGTGLVQLTDGRRNDYHACWLPSDRIVFVSDRRNVVVRCHPGSNIQPCGAMYSIKADGSDMVPISYHETTELTPSVDNDGMLVYTRWDYVDRDFSAAHHIWRCFPDGRDPRAPHGNYAFPHSTMDATGNSPDGRADRPWAEYSIMAVPGTSGKYVACAGGHHTAPNGPLVMIDITVPDDYRMSQVKRIMPQFCIPNESADQNAGFFEDPNCRTKNGHHFTPWPLSEDYYLAARGSAVYLIDKFGNSEQLLGVAAAQVNGVTSIRHPIPLRARPRPPVLPTRTWQGERFGAPDHEPAVISMVNVYESDFAWPANTRITELRIIQLIPKPWEKPFQNSPRVSQGAVSTNARMVLGTVPVESDGSAYFYAPVGKAIYFQALDQNGCAVQSMRSGTYAHPGEHLSCTGCHESKWKATPPPTAQPIALRRAPSQITPECDPAALYPLTYARLVEPLVKNVCTPCHQKNGRSGPNVRAYEFSFHGAEWSHGLLPVKGGYRATAGTFGAIYTGMARIMAMQHHVEALTKEQRRRITMWVDANSPDLGAYINDKEQRAGQVVWPLLDVDPANPTGVEQPGAVMPSIALSARNGAVPFTVSFDAAAQCMGSGCPTAADMQWTWDFGDGAGATGRSVTHTYGTAGTFAPRLTVSWNGGSAAKAEQVVARGYRDAETPTGVVPGLLYSYYEGYAKLPDQNAPSPTAAGVADSLDISFAKVEDRFAFRFVGYVKVPADGEYTFYLSSDDGSRMYLGTEQAATKTMSLPLLLRAGYHPITVDFYEGGGGQYITLSWQPPTGARERVPASTFYYVSGQIPLPAGSISMPRAGLAVRQVRGSVTVHFGRPSPRAVEMVDCGGRVAWRARIAGTAPVVIDSKTVTPGVYLLRVRQAGTAATRRVRIVR